MHSSSSEGRQRTDGGRDEGRKRQTQGLGLQGRRDTHQAKGSRSLGDSPVQRPFSFREKP